MRLPALFRPLTAAFATLGLAFALPACAQPAPTATKDADPALWVVKDKDTTIYLFGTIHVLKPGLSWFDEAVKKAFDKSGTLVLEMVEPDQATQQKVVLSKAFALNGPTLSEQLPPEKRAAIAKAVNDNGLPLAQNDRRRDASGGYSGGRGSPRSACRSCRWRSWVTIPPTAPKAS